LGHKYQSSSEYNHETTSGRKYQTISEEQKQSQDKGKGKGKGKGKAIPLQAWTGSEGSRRLRLPNFKTIGT